MAEVTVTLTLPEAYSVRTLILSLAKPTPQLVAVKAKLETEIRTLFTQGAK